MQLNSSSSLNLLTLLCFFSSILSFELNLKSYYHEGLSLIVPAIAIESILLGTTVSRIQDILPRLARWVLSLSVFTAQFLLWLNTTSVLWRQQSSLIDLSDIVSTSLICLCDLGSMFIQSVWSSLELGKSMSVMTSCWLLSISLAYFSGLLNNILCKVKALSWQLRRLSSY